MKTGEKSAKNFIALLEKEFGKIKRGDEDEYMMLLLALAPNCWERIKQ